MKPREITKDVHWVGAVDWDRRVFDSLIPLPEGTTYNAYLVQGSEKTALVDTVDPSVEGTLLDRLAQLGVKRIDYVVSNHAEQDHSGSIPAVLARFPGAKVLATPKGVAMLADLMPLPAGSLVEVADGEEVSLGDMTLRFLHFPWVHWPETMLTYVPERRLLLPGDLFGSHLATNELVSCDCERERMASKSYYAEIMMPFRKIIGRNLARLDGLAIDLIAPSHGPVHGDPQGVIERYRRWTSDEVESLVVLPYISMHSSTRTMVERLIEGLTDRGIRVERFNVEDVDIGKLATTLVDAATIVIGTPTIAGGPHPKIVYAAYLANMLRPKARWATVVGSFGWGGTTVQQLAAMLKNLDVELLDPVLSKGRPGTETLAALDTLAGQIADRHATLRAPA
jgi:flavorubredoxin